MTTKEYQRNIGRMGSVSTGTMRSEDLIPCFVDTLRSLPDLKRADRPKLREIERRMRHKNYFESEDAMFDLHEDLFPMLDQYAPPYFYFGAHPGDGSDYGFWLHDWWDEEFSTLADVEKDSDKLKVSDLSEVPGWFVGDVAVVNDHGNVTLYRRPSNHRFYPVWAVI
jgi:hypothetical protein